MRRSALVLGCLLVLAACHRKPSVTHAIESVPPSGDVAAVGAPAAAPRRVTLKSTGPAPAEIWKEFSGDRAFAEVRRQVEVGPRPSGSPELEKVRAQIIEFLEREGWEAERQEFTDTTPRGAIQFVNIIGRFSATGDRPVPRTTQRAIVCSHFDTKRFSTIKFVGASDGASSSGALLELARVLALDPALAAKVELVFFDGEEAVQQFTESDGLYGSRHYASSLRESGRTAHFEFGILWDMIGDKDLTITLSPDSPAALTKALLEDAETLGVRSHFGYHNQHIYDDHVPLNTARIPTIDLIDFDYLPWHTADDTLDKLSPESLKTIGAVTLLHLHRALAAGK